MKILYERKREFLQISKDVNMHFPAHIHEDVELLYCLSGNIRTLCDGQEMILSANELVISLPNTIHSYETIEKSSYVLCIFSPSALPLFKGHFSHTSPFPFLRATETEGILSHLNFLLAEASSTKNYELMVSLLSVILSLIFQKVSLTKKRSDSYDDILPALLRYLEEHFVENCTLSDTASTFALNPSYLSRLFAGRIQCTFTHYIHELRVNYAKQLLQYTDKPITEIAYECGFSTQRTFNRVFYQITNLSPRAYRGQML